MADKIFINPPLTALNHVYGFTGETLVTSPIPSMNSIINGENIAVLKSLLPELSNAVNCIIVDLTNKGSSTNWQQLLSKCFPILFRLLHDMGAIYVFMNEVDVSSLKSLINDDLNEYDIAFSIVWQRSASVNEQGDYIGLNDYIICISKKENIRLKYSWIPQLSPNNNQPVLAWYSEDVGDNEEATTYFNNLLLDATKSIGFIKPVRLIERILKNELGKDGIVLDVCAGIGTTAHSVLHLNNKDNGNRSFLLVEDHEFCKTITAEGLQRIIKGTATQKGIKGDFNYYTINEKAPFNNQ
jgi:adenine specific DNA methylase Mod